MKLINIIIGFFKNLFKKKNKKKDDNYPMW
jgi:hypothetical protein